MLAAELSHSQLGRAVDTIKAGEVINAAVRAYAQRVAPPGAWYGERFWVRA